MFLYVVAWGWSEGITAVQGFGMGDLTEVGKSLIALLHYWWVFYIPFGNQSEPFLELQRAQGKNAAGCLSTIYHGKGRFHPTERLMDIGSDVLQGLMDVTNPALLNSMDAIHSQQLTHSENCSTLTTSELPSELQTDVIVLGQYLALTGQWDAHGWLNNSRWWWWL